MILASAEQIAGPGAHITCPQCHKRIGTLTRTLYQGHTFGLDAIRFVAGQYPAGGAAACRKCGASYAEQDVTVSPKGGRSSKMLVHTEYGWLPHPPPNVPPPPRKPIVDESKIR